MAASLVRREDVARHRRVARFARSLASPSGLQLLARKRTRKVIRIEDPIEYAIEDVEQTRVNPALGFDFAQALRFLVRQDPDVILVGEIRHSETALESLRTSQTGHLALSPVHANDAVDAVQRLFDLGQHPNSIAAGATGESGSASSCRRRETCGSRSRTAAFSTSSARRRGRPA